MDRRGRRTILPLLFAFLIALGVGLPPHVVLAVASTAPSASAITVTNNVEGTPDTVEVTSLTAADVVKVYGTSTTSTVLGTGTVGAGESALTISIAQLKKTAGSVYVTVTTSPNTESTRTQKAYLAEPKSTAPSASNITVTNNYVGTNDSVVVTGLGETDVVKLYATNTTTTTLGTATVAGGETAVTISIAQLGLKAGKVYLSVTSTDMWESTRTAKDYVIEPTAETPLAESITITNNYEDTSDTVVVTGLSEDDVVRVYPTSSSAVVLGSDRVGAGESSATVSIYQLGVKSGTAYVTVVAPSKHESGRRSKAYSAEDVSTAPSVGSIAITNNYIGTDDTLVVSGLSPSDEARVYAVATGGTALGGATVAGGETTATITMAQIGIGPGKVYVSVKSTSKQESTRTAASFLVEPTSTAPTDSNITVTNNLEGTDDTVLVSGLTDGDVVRVYATASGTVPLGMAVVGSGETSATVTMTQLGKKAGKVYVSATGASQHESARTNKAYTAEELSTAPTGESITITNNYGDTADSVLVTGLSEADIVKVYASTVAVVPLASATVGAGESTATVTVTQLGKSNRTIYVTVTSTDKLESTRMAKAFDKEPTTAAPIADNITVTNNVVGTDDTLLVTGLSPDDIVRVYDTSTGLVPLGTGTIGAGETSVTISITQIGLKAGNLYVTATAPSEHESSRTVKAFSAEVVSTAPTDGEITVTNNYGDTLDTVVVSNRSDGDLIKVYATAAAAAPLATGTVASGETTVSISMAQLGQAAGKIYLSATSSGKAESSRMVKSFSQEATVTAPVAESITVTNNVTGTADIVQVNGLQENDIVRVYATAKVTTPIGMATVASGETVATISITQLGIKAGKVYVSVTAASQHESLRTAQSYLTETVSTAPTAESITVTNSFFGTPDTVVVTGVSEGDLVSLYTSSNAVNAIGSTLVGAGETVATVSIAQLGLKSGSIYLSITSTEMLESKRTAKPFTAEAPSTAPVAENITITNNSEGTIDTVVVSNLAEDDKVRVYAKANSTVPLGTATVSAGETSATVNIYQIGKTSGKVYLSVTSTDKRESSFTVKTYDAELTSTAPSDSNITITNNFEGTSDTVAVTGLQASDVVKVYDVAKGGNPLGGGTVAGGETGVTITIYQLGEAAGKVYVAVATPGKLESSRTIKTFLVEPTSTAPTEGNITVNNVIDSDNDTVTVAGLTENDVVRIYATSSDTTPLGLSTVGSGETSATLAITQLGTKAGKIYVTATSPSMHESSRTLKEYLAEDLSTAPAENTITVTNNFQGTADTVVLTGLAEDDRVSVYDSAKAASPLASATVGAGESTGTVTVTQLGKAAGKIYVTVTSIDKLESTRTLKSFEKEPTSVTPESGNISSVNNLEGTDDSVIVIGLGEADTVRVYANNSVTTPLGMATVGAGETGVTVTVTQLGKTGGNVYVSVTSTDMHESARSVHAVVAEDASDAPGADSITVTNNYDGTPDTVAVTALAESDLVQVYDASKGGNMIGKATVGGGESAVTISIAQLGTAAGRVYVTTTSTDMLESGRTAKAYDKEPTTTAPVADNITPTNNLVGTDDTVQVTGLEEGAILRVYATSSTKIPLGTATVGSGESAATVTITQLGLKVGKVYVSITNPSEHESSRTAKAFNAEVLSDAPTAEGITVTNNYEGTPDTVQVTGLAEADLVKVYTSAKATNWVGSATVAGGESAVTISIAQLGSAAGSIYVSVTSTDNLESTRTTKAYLKEPTNDAPDGGTITVTNNPEGTVDTVVVTGLSAGDVVRVYATGSVTTPLGTATVSAGQSEATVNIYQLKTTAGSIYVAVQSPNQHESSRTSKAYTAEEVSTAPASVTVTNNYQGTLDTVQVTGLAEDDIVNVYAVSKGGNSIGSATVSAGESAVTISIYQLGTASGKVYVSVTSTAKLESPRTLTSYDAEAASTAPADITVTNNAEGTDDQVVVAGLAEGDVVRIYATASDTTAIGHGTVGSGETSVTITFYQLGATAGTIYVTVTSAEEHESPRTAKTYTAE